MNQREKIEKDAIFDYVKKLQRNQERKKKMIALRESGWTLARIAAKYNLTRQRVSVILSKWKP